MIEQRLHNMLIEEENNNDNLKGKDILIEKSFFNNLLSYYKDQMGFLQTIKESDVSLPFIKYLKDFDNEEINALQEILQKSILANNLNIFKKKLKETTFPIIIKSDILLNKFETTKIMIPFFDNPKENNENSSKDINEQIKLIAQIILKKKKTYLMDHMIKRMPFITTCIFNEMNNSNEEIKNVINYMDIIKLLIKNIKNPNLLEIIKKHTKTALNKGEHKNNWCDLSNQNIEEMARLKEILKIESSKRCNCKILNYVKKEVYIEIEWNKILSKETLIDSYEKIKKNYHKGFVYSTLKIIDKEVQRKLKKRQEINLKLQTIQSGNTQINIVVNLLSNEEKDCEKYEVEEENYKNYINGFNEALIKTLDNIETLYAYYNDMPENEQQQETIERKKITKAFKNKVRNTINQNKESALNSNVISIRELPQEKYELLVLDYIDAGDKKEIKPIINHMGNMVELNGWKGVPTNNSYIRQYRVKENSKIRLSKFENEKLCLKIEDSSNYLLDKRYKYYDVEIIKQVLEEKDLIDSVNNIEINKQKKKIKI